MSDDMYMSFEQVTRPKPQNMFSAAADAAETVTPKHIRRVKIRWLLAGWAALSVLWAGGVSYNVYQRISTQADMSRDVEADLDQGFVNASCSGSQCGGGEAVRKTQNWSGIASTYFRFGSTDMIEYTFGPPLVLLVLGTTTTLMLRRRRANA
jgi:hypothetical protein